MISHTYINHLKVYDLLMTIHIIVIMATMRQYHNIEKVDE